MQNSNDEYGSTNNLLKCVENNPTSPGPSAESISPASPAVAGILLFLHQTHCIMILNHLFSDVSDLFITQSEMVRSANGWI